MNAPRSLQVLRSRWWLVVVVAVIGAGTAYLANLLTDVGGDQAYEGVAPISVLRLDQEADSRYARRLETALTQAETAVAAQLVNTKLSVRADATNGTIEFASSGANPDDALRAATDLRAVYLNTRPVNTAADQLAPVLEALATEISVVEAELAAMGPIGADEVAEVQRQALTVQLEVATRELVAVKAQLLNPSLSIVERNELDAQQSSAEATIAAIGPLLEELPAGSYEIAETQDRLEALVLQRRLRDLESKYVATSLRVAEGESQGLVAVPFVFELSRNTLSPLLSTLLGLAVGAFLGALAVVASDRVNDPVRTVDDASGLTTIRVSRRPRRQVGSIDWYSTAEGKSRRVDVQALRARVDRLAGRGKVVLIGGVGAAPRDVVDVGIDLATSVAVTGRTVLFIDTRVTESTSGQWEEAGPALAEILKSQDGVVPDRSIIKRMLWDRPQVVPNLFVVPAGDVFGDPVDELAGLNFTAVVDEARDLVDLVVLATGEVTDPLSEAVAGRSRVAVLTAQRDRTRKKEVIAAAASLEQLGVSVAAVALLVGQSARGPQATTAPTSGTQGTRIAEDLSARHLG